LSWLVLRFGINLPPQTLLSRICSEGDAGHGAHTRGRREHSAAAIRRGDCMGKDKIETAAPVPAPAPADDVVDADKGTECLMTTDAHLEGHGVDD
jgi:hypothetical protein